ncbi:hypothetical protein DXA74_08055 [Bacteroides sp. OF04-15BH]|nr:hypothetical protein DXA74_08055 [Bacteroides sp. OF04-15BH]
MKEAFNKVKKHRKRYDGNPVFYLRGDFSYWSKFSDLSSRNFLTVLAKTGKSRIQPMKPEYDSFFCFIIS